MGQILATTATSPAALEAYDRNDIGGDIAGGRLDLGQLFTRPAWRLDPYSTPDPAILPRLRVDAAGRRGARDAGAARCSIGGPPASLRAGVMLARPQFATRDATPYEVSA